MIFVWILIPVLVLAALYILSTRCRKGHPGLEAIRQGRYAHRGLHGNGLPENSMAAFRAAYDAGYGIELDLHLLKDGNLAVIHDSPLIRTTGAEGVVEDLTTEDLKKYRLEGTEETIPTFAELLELYKGDYPLVVELKAYKGNHAALCKATCDMLESYPGAYCIESFDPRCVHWLKKNRPQVIRGQLSENFLRNKKSPLAWILKLVLTFQMSNFLTVPDFVAYRFCDRNHISNKLVRAIWGVQGVTWTIKTQQEFDTAVAEDWTPIFEDFNP